MHFLIETVNNEVESVDVFVAYQNLKRWKFVHTFEFCDASDLPNINVTPNETIPIGNIPFVKKFLELYFPNISMTPVEIPSFLQDEFFTKRNYKIVPKSEVPSTGKFFFKNASVLKSFIFNNFIDVFESHTDLNFDALPNDHLYVVSESVEFECEYRCFIHNGEIEGVQFYNGEWLKFGDDDLKNMLLSAISLIDKNMPSLKSYTIDVGYIPNRGWAIIEIHTMVSVGLYGFDTYRLCDYYINGFQFYLNDSEK